MKEAQQHTIQRPVTVQGQGLHSGVTVNLTFKPASPNYGYKFKRVDLPEQPIIKADVDLVSHTQRSTSLSYKGATVSTVEHVLAALVGLQIDNVLIEVDAQELPIMDGSAKDFISVLKEAGIQKQAASRSCFTLTETISLYDAERDTQMLAVPANDYTLTTLIDFNSSVLGKQYATLKNINDFEQHIGQARTFCFVHELKFLLKNNLIKGGNLSNALVIAEQEMDAAEQQELADLLGEKAASINGTGYLNNTPLRYPNEAARHKLLDVIGDLALIGTPIKAHIIATKPGHTSNVDFAKLIKAHIKKQRHLVGLPTYDTRQAAVYDIQKIMATLPHRYPFLLVDKIIKLTDNQVVGVKNITYNENFFQGHFPNEPIMPGVLIIEAMAQTGGVLLLNTVPDPQNYLTFFLKIQEARFRNPVVPGDTLIFKLDLVGTIRRGLCEMKATAYTSTKIAAEATLVAQIRRKN